MFPGIDKREEAHHITLQSCDPPFVAGSLSLSLSLMGLISVAGRHSTISREETESLLGNRDAGRVKGKKEMRGKKNTIIRKKLRKKDDEKCHADGSKRSCVGTNCDMGDFCPRSIPYRHVRIGSEQVEGRKRCKRFLQRLSQLPSERIHVFSQWKKCKGEI